MLNIVYATCLTLFAWMFTPSALSVEPSDAMLAESIEYTEILTDLPVEFDIDTATKEAFSSLQYFTETEIDNIIRFRDSLDKGITLSSSIDDVPGLSTIQRTILAHLADTKQSAEKGSGILDVRSGFMHRANGSSLASDGYYARIMNRDSSRFGATLLIERDTGEPYALDLLSLSAVVTGGSNDSYIVIGDFRPEFGQGLVFSRYGRSYVYGTDVSRRKPGKVANTSFEESLFCRGIYAHAKYRSFLSSIWVSSRRLDATIDGKGDAVTIQNDGIHMSGDNSRDNLSERLIGGHFSFAPLAAGTLGVTGAYTDYSPGIGRLNREYTLHALTGDSFGHFSVDGRYGFEGGVIFFEHALTNNRKRAMIAGGELKRTGIKAAVLARRYDPGYRAPRSAAFSSFGKTENEKGVYTAIETRIPGGFRCEVTLDLASTLYRSYSDDMPISRRSLFLAIDRRLVKCFRLGLSLRSVDDGNGSETRRHQRLSLTRESSRGFPLAMRTALTRSSCEKESGYLGEAGFRLRKKRLTGDISVGQYDIPSYTSRVYHYERDAPGRGRTSALWGRGTVIILLLRCGPASIRYLYRDSTLMMRVDEFRLQIDSVF